MSRKTQQSHGGIHTPLMACYLAVHDSADGLPVIAFKMEKNQDTLRKKLDSKQTTHHLTLAEAMHILRITHDPRILDAICTEIGVIWIDAEALPAVPADMDVLKSGTELMNTAVQVLTELEQALDNGSIDADEQARLNKRFLELAKAAKKIAFIAEQFEE
ncbi:MAG: phage regulatory CII family protein [Oceanospirillaceae bacterium]|nr:phage regulatory CII family protein [Oceanospirillaceae bacterium]